MIRVLHVLGVLNRGGAETMIMNLYRNIDRSKIQFDFVVHTKEKCDYDDEVKSLGGIIHRIPKYSGKNHFNYKQSWNDFFTKHPEYKIVHGHVRSTASIYLKIAKKHNLVTISHSHNTSSGRGLSAVVKNTLQYPIRYIADYLFACSEFAGVWLFGKNALKKDNFHILNNSIDSKKFVYDSSIRDKKRKEFSLEGKYVVGHIGRFHTQKNHMFLIDIFKELHVKDENTVLMLVGDGDLEGQVKQKVAELGLSEHVIFTGVRPDIPELLQAMDVFLFPSLFEGLGMVAVEAQASGLKCIVADTIPKEAFVTDLIEAIPLNASIDIWVNKIMDCRDYERRNTYNEICENGYDIRETSKWIENFYLNRKEVLISKAQ